jgi:hypothetical protein
MAATTGHSINTRPYGENTEIYSSLKLLHWLNLNCIHHWKVLYKLCVFYVDRNSKMTTTAGHSFYIGPIGFFYNQVNYRLLRASGIKLLKSDLTNITSDIYCSWVMPLNYV